MGKIQENTGKIQAVGALRPEETRGDNSYQNPGSKMHKEYYPTGTIFSYPRETNREGTRGIKPRPHCSKSSDLLLANPTNSQKAKEPPGCNPDRSGSCGRE